MYYLGKEQNINTHTTSTRVGTSITSFIQTLEYENILVREQVSIYSNYLTFFHNSQREYLNKLLLKIQTFQKEIEEEIFMHYKPPALPTIEDSTVSTPENVIAENESPNIVITIDESTNLENMIKDAENNAENGGESNEETPTEETSLSE